MRQDKTVEPLYERYPDSVPGPFYVIKDQCIICGLPPETAPECIAWSQETFRFNNCMDCPTHCRIERQPETEEEIAAAIEAACGSCVEAIRYCAALGRKGPRHEPWVTNGEIIAGLEPPESSIRAIDWVTSMGAIPTVCVFRPLVGTDLQDAEPPKTSEMVPVFRRLYEACMERGLPIGCAPNVRVSLVMLPEECRSLSPRRFPLQRMKLAAMSTAFGYQFRRRTERAERGAALAHAS
jgi:hypothetical protein